MSDQELLTKIHDKVTRLDERVNGPNGALEQLNGLREDVSKLKSFKVHVVALASGIATGASFALHKALSLFK